MPRAVATLVLALISALWAYAAVRTIASLVPASQPRVEVIELAPEPTTTSTVTTVPSGAAPPPPPAQPTVSTAPPPHPAPPPVADDDDVDDDGDEGEGTDDG